MSTLLTVCIYFPKHKCPFYSTIGRVRKQTACKKNIIILGFIVIAKHKPDAKHMTWSLYMLISDASGNVMYSITCSQSRLELCEPQQTAEDMFQLRQQSTATLSSKAALWKSHRDGHKVWRGLGWRRWVMDAAQPQSPHRLREYVLQQMGLCTFHTVIHDWNQGSEVTVSYWISNIWWLAC